jgi:hypothetical protein
MQLSRGKSVSRILKRFPAPNHYGTGVHALLESLSKVDAFPNFHNFDYRSIESGESQCLT